MLSPGWRYKLNVVKEIKGTKEFLSLSNTVKDCQIETNSICTTRSYVNRIVEKCGCLPLHMLINPEPSQVYSTVVNLIQTEVKKNFR